MGAMLCMGGGAAEITFNGTFEDATANKNGILWPRYWHKTTMSKNTQVRLTKEPTEVRTGKFSFLIEQEEKNSVANVRYLKAFPAKVGDKINITLYARGKGKLNMMLILYRGNTSRFLRTIGCGGAKNIDSPDKWSKFEYKGGFPQLKDKDGLIPSYGFLPVIHVTGEAELLIDDMKMEVIPVAAKK